MKKQSSSNDDFQPDQFGELPLSIARFAFFAGMIVLGISLAAAYLLLSQAANLGNDAGAKEKATQIVSNFGLFQKGLVLGSILTVAGSAYLFWEEEIMVALNLFVAGALYFAPNWVPFIAGGPAVSSSTYTTGVETIQSAGSIYGSIAILILVADIALRVRQRATHGTKADQLKYGKGVKEEKKNQNVFMGKCWQLPFCREFVRDRCPIYHAKRTCWKELVGCMCEESVIRTAMENKPVSKEALLSGAAIPRNTKLTVKAKRERCKNCVIYNEHQKHKYRLALPLIVLGYIGIWLVFRDVMASGVNGLMGTASKTVSQVTAGAVNGAANTGEIFVQFLVICILLVALSYTLKMLEFVVFRLKL